LCATLRDKEKAAIRTHTDSHTIALKAEPDLDMLRLKTYQA